MSSNWQYMGDVNISYGGFFANLDDNDIQYGYVEVIRVIDGNDAGAEGLSIIERLTVFDILDKEKIKSALSTIGMTTKDLRGMGKEAILMALIGGFLAYGHYDPAFDMYGPTNWAVVNIDSYNGDKRGWESWNVDRSESVRLAKEFDHDLRAYVESFQ
jgi:hypothetical protein